jgi:hypothetical protein
MRQLSKVPALANDFARLELAKERIVAFNVPNLLEDWRSLTTHQSAPSIMTGDSKPVASIVGVVPYGKNDQAIFHRFDDAWYIKLTSPAEQLLRPFHQAGYVVLDATRHCYHVKVETQAALHDAPAHIRLYDHLVGTLGDRKYDDYCRTDAQRSHAPLGCDVPGGHYLSHPSKPGYLALQEMRMLQTCGSLSRNSFSIFDHNMEAAKVAEAAFASKEQPLTNPDKAMLHTFASSLQEQSAVLCREECERLNKKLHALAPYDAQRMPQLEELEWWLTQRLSVIPENWRKEKVSVRRRLEEVREELLGFYGDWRRDILRWLNSHENPSGSNLSGGPAPGVMEAQKKRSYCLALRMQQLCLKLGLKQAAKRHYDDCTRGLEIEDFLFVSSELKTLRFGLVC